MTDGIVLILTGIAIFGLGWVLGHKDGAAMMQKHVDAGWDAAADHEMESIRRGEALLAIQAEAESLRAFVEADEHD